MSEKIIVKFNEGSAIAKISKKKNTLFVELSHGGTAKTASYTHSDIKTAKVGVAQADGVPLCLLDKPACEDSNIMEFAMGLLYKYYPGISALRLDEAVPTPEYWQPN